MEEEIANAGDAESAAAAAHRDGAREAGPPDRHIEELDGILRD